MHKVCGTLDNCFITTHNSHKDGDILQIYFCVIYRETRHHAQASITSWALIQCPFLDHENTDRSTIGLMISLVTVYYTFFFFSSFFFFIFSFFSSPSFPPPNFSTPSSSPPSPSPLPPSPSSSPPPTQNSLLKSLAPQPNFGVCNQNFTVGFSSSIFFRAIAQYPQSSTLFRLLHMTGHSFRNTIPVS